MSMSQHCRNSYAFFCLFFSLFFVCFCWAVVLKAAREAGCFVCQFLIDAQVGGRPTQNACIPSFPIYCISTQPLALTSCAFRAQTRRSNHANEFCKSFLGFQSVVEQYNGVSYRSSKVRVRCSACCSENGVCALLVRQGPLCISNQCISNQCTPAPTPRPPSPRVNRVFHFQSFRSPLARPPLTVLSLSAPWPGCSPGAYSLRCSPPARCSHHPYARLIHLWHADHRQPACRRLRQPYQHVSKYVGGD
jgi:hypothetical protein